MILAGRPKPKRRERNTAAVKEALVKAGRRLFGMHGFEKTSLAQICAEAGATNGSLYHHFEDKTGLLRAVLVELDREAIEIGRAGVARAFASGVTDPWEATICAIENSIEQGLMDPGRRRIFFVDAAAGLGVEGWRELHESHALGALIAMIKQFQDSGVLIDGDPRQLARMIEGVIFGAVETFPENPEDGLAMLPGAKRLARTMLQALRKPAGASEK